MVTARGGTHQRRPREVAFGYPSQPTISATANAEKKTANVLRDSLVPHWNGLLWNDIARPVLDCTIVAGHGLPIQILNRVGGGNTCLDSTETPVGNVLGLDDKDGVPSEAC